MKKGVELIEEKIRVCNLAAAVGGGELGKSNGSPDELIPSSLIDLHTQLQFVVCVFDCLITEIDDDAAVGVGVGVILRLYGS